MSMLEELLKSKIQPKEKQTQLVNAVVQKKIPAKEFIGYFESGSDVDKGTLADVMKHVSEQDPDLLAPFIDRLVKFINYKASRVKWGVPEAIGNMAKKYPDKVVPAIPFLLVNTVENKTNTTVIRWCAAYALSEIAKNNPKTRDELLPVFSKIIETDTNNGVKNVYNKSLKAINRKK
jgi:hypothetical protein